ncbi:MAG: hypothetical protein J0I84_18010 [Terrimonas sp.]|uniref:hypothetical protein n=1 Tax=uncultured Dysgonomonas sp. TaxID=206096 RepID=UPI000926327A|nr:hypothetical protein [uncultured Dysgonomonas sp.]MBN8788983.1 hypothetical protein [Terrimonas sp.]OJY97899.1 MAG: hypothetical protein BGP13_09525 [Sphingobacteriales bacterium 40-81]
MTKEEITILKAIAICYKPYLKPEEAMIYCNLGSTQLLVKTKALGIYKNASGYYKKEDLDMMMSGITNLSDKLNKK